MSEKLEVLDMIITTLLEHEKELDRLIHELRTQVVKPVRRGQQLNETERRFYDNL